ncbi:2Fe-2S iron-sulfur cluster binding domain-containing protein [Candidatus Acetothermia bacterium]|nr:2Fe-2S iron-sulfur cluster binding domain-containing protein [Candidatus Acetothermia bacterium]MBI3644007.1 2Fe-2S iron-sulfur cluster binding domain-containing protein [Candidatus Acetothermia bacterium]
MSAKTVQLVRAEWEGQKWVWRWMTIAIGTLGFLIVFFTIRQFELGLVQIIESAAVGLIVCQLVALAVEALFEKFKTTDPPTWAQVLLIVLLVSLIAYLIYSSEIATFSALLVPVLIGGSVLTLLHTLKKSREVHQPRCFVEIENTGDVVSLKQGEMLIRGLESAGYKLLTQCSAQGECASCRVRVLQKNQDLDDKNYGPVLTPRQKNEGWVIACQMPVENDMLIRLYKPLMLLWPVFSRHEMTPLAKELRVQLPGFDCEACGLMTCDQFAQAVAQGKASPDGCFPGGSAVTERLKSLLSGVKSASTQHA